jgi:phage/plasmid-like protein (TIGR03299 family)
MLKSFPRWEFNVLNQQFQSIIISVKTSEEFTDMAHLITASDVTLFARKPAWHGLGIVTAGDVPLEALKNAWSFSVTKEPLFTVQGEETTTFATIRTNPDQTRAVMGDKLSASYQILHNATLLEALNPLLEAGLAIETGGTLDGGSKVWALMSIPGDMIVGRQDRIKRFVLLSNDHSGREAARTGFTPVRVECANKLAQAHDSRQSQLLRVRHNGGEVNVNFINATKLIDTANQQFLAYGSQLDVLAGKGVSQSDLRRYVKQVFMPKLDEAMDTSTLALAAKESYQKDLDKLARLRSTIDEIFQAEPSVCDQVDTAGTAYGLYQSVNFYLNHVTSGGFKSLAFGVNEAVDARALSLAGQF